MGGKIRGREAGGNTTTHFGTIYRKRRTFNKGMKEQYGGFKSTNTITSSRSYNDGWKNAMAEIAKRKSPLTINTTPNNHMFATTTSPKAEWVEYSNSLEDSLTEGKDYTAVISKKPDNQRESLLTELKEQRKQTAPSLAAVEKLTDLLGKSKVTNNDNNDDPPPHA